MNKFMTILNISLKVFAILVLIIVAFISLTTAYIIFAPDDLPKPFRLVYDYSTPVTSFMLSSAYTPSPTPHIYRPGEGIMVDMSTKIINLADPSGRKYIRLTMVLEFEPDNLDYLILKAEEKATYIAEFQGRMNEKMPLLDDIVITLLSTKTFDQLYTAEGKEMLRQEIIRSINGRAPGVRLISVYFTEFVVQ